MRIWPDGVPLTRSVSTAFRVVWGVGWLNRWLRRRRGWFVVVRAVQFGDPFFGRNTVFRDGPYEREIARAETRRLESEISANGWQAKTPEQP